MIIAVSLVISYYFGTKRYIGFGWTLFFCLTGGLILAIPVIVTSTKKNLPPKDYFSTQKVIGWIIAILATLGFFGMINAISNSGSMTNNTYDRALQVLGFMVFFIGLGIYLITSSVYNSKYHSGKLSIQNANNPNQNWHKQKSPSASNQNSTNPVTYNGGHNSQQNSPSSSTTQKSVNTKPHNPVSSSSNKPNKGFSGSNPYSKN